MNEKENHNQSQNEKESNIDIIGTLKMFIQGDEPELSQEEAIEMFNINKKNNSSDEDSDTENTEEAEHMKRIKHELLESLKRVEKLEKDLFKEDTTKTNLKSKDDIKIKGRQQVGVSNKKEFEVKEEITKEERE